jgi:transposase
MKRSTDASFVAFIGIDWAHQKHDVCLEAGGQRERSILPHAPEAIDRWVRSLRSRFGERSIAIALELEKGPLVAALQKHPGLVLFPVNPSLLAKYREAFTPSRAKDDPTDAELALELLLHHRAALKPLKTQSGDLRALGELLTDRRRLVGDKGRITNRLIDTLKQYYPQALDWFDDRDTEVFCDFLSRWPTLIQAKRARCAVLEAFFRGHNTRYTKVIERRIAAIRAATPLTEDEAIIKPHALFVGALVAQLRVVRDAIARYDEEIERLSASIPDYDFFKNLPGAGPALAPRLLIAFGEDRDRYDCAAALQKYSGIAPVTERSGQKSWVHWRYGAPTFLRQTFIEWSAQTIRHSFWARAFYDQQRSKGASHQAALRTLAFKWIRILFRCWKDRTPYDEARYLAALQLRSSPLLRNALHAQNA